MWCFSDENDLHDCLNIIRKGFGTVADELGLTDENCPDRGGASMPYDIVVWGQWFCDCGIQKIMATRR